MAILSSIFPWGSPTKSLHEFVPPYVHDILPAHVICLDLYEIGIWYEYKLWSSSFCIFPPSCSYFFLRFWQK